MTDRAYFDYAATAPCEPQVAAQLAEDLTAPWAFANAGATYHPALENRRRLEDARAQLAAVIGADAREIVFTSGATEADNLALKGALGYHGVKQPHLITVQSEHKAVLDPAGALAKAGAKITMLPVGRDGLLDLDALDEALATAPTLVSVMAVNNETGVVQPIADIAARVHRAGARLHVDAAQALGKLALDVRGWDIDMLSLSGHKIGAPVGTAADRSAAAAPVPRRSPSSAPLPSPPTSPNTHARRAGNTSRHYAPRCWPGCLRRCTPTCHRKPRKCRTS